MNISEAKQIDIIDYLKDQNITCHHRKGNRCWFCAPYRSETTPSMKVDKDRNEWWDFGIDEGGDLIDLCKKLYNTNDTSQVLKLIEQNAPTLVNNLVRTRNAPTKHQVENDMRNIVYGPLEEVALQSYLMRRKINLRWAQGFCQEVHYTLRGKNYFAIAFPNRIGGYEVRNQYFKGCIGHKDISFVPWFRDQMCDECMVFEGFMDWMSYYTIINSEKNIFKDITQECDSIVLNTVACINRALDLLSHYKVIHCFLDNDEAGKRTLEVIHKRYPAATVDESHRYKEENDVNDYLVKRL